VTTEARRIQGPTLVIHGRDDPVIVIDAGRTLASLISNARFEIVEGGHREGTGNSPEVRAQILRFIDEAAASPASGG
jgi:non-heme chloroperoxidase